MKNFALGLLLIPLMTGCNWGEAPNAEMAHQDGIEEVRVDETRGYKTVCGFQDGTKWLPEFQECEFLEKERCESVDGAFMECESACRHDKDAEMCIQMCVPVCSWAHKAAEAKICNEKGGAWASQGMLGLPACVMSFSDARKSCASSSECQGDCIVTEVDGPASCSPSDGQFGCHSTIEDVNNGEGILCVD